MIVLEFAERGSLSSYLKSNLTFSDGEQVCTLPDEEKLNIGLDIAKGMRHLASVKVEWLSSVCERVTTQLDAITHCHLLSKENVRCSIV